MQKRTPRTPVPPVAPRESLSLTLHGDTRPDEYAWLRRKDDPEVIAYLEAENRYTDAMMRPSVPLQGKLYREMVSRIKETDMGVPYREGDWYYYSRTTKGRQYPTYCRRFRSLRAREQIVLDLNRLARGHPFLGLGALDVSPDGRRVAFSTDYTGFREYTLRVMDLDTGKVLPVEVPKTRSIAWSADSAALFYVTEDDAKRACRVWRHRLGRDDHDLVYEETDTRFSVGVDLARSRAHVFITSHSATTSEVRFVPAADPDAEPRLVQARRKGHEYYVDSHGEQFYIVTNDRGRNFRLVTASADRCGQRAWRELIPHRDDTMLEGVDLFARHYVLHERRDGFPRMTVVRQSDGDRHEIEFPEPAYSAFAGANAEFDTDVFRFAYESFVTPDSVYDYDMNSRKRVLLKRFEVRGGYDPKHYRTELLHARAPDGTTIPVSLVYRHDRRRRAARPMLLSGYGAYGYPEMVTFSSTRLSLLDRGVIFALAHVRGGGEMGKRWHDEGRMMQKKNTFHDFIACAEHVIAEGYTAPDRLVIEGGSAGGLLMGAVVNMRPELFRAVVSEVPFVDVINTMLDDTLPLTTGEYEEWGNPNERRAYTYMRSYSPYDNLHAHAYPAMLVETALNDSQVMYWEPAKYVARMRTLKTDGNPLLLRINMDAGHGGASGRYDYLREIAFRFAFILGVVGITD
ncbi:MAG: prolyl oligopeptidase family serine peptidase [Betaproteobacteria bacterium]|nr:prolyl oligopeptidase family serine peptidase [Betaproteobacteria bacterium]